MIGYRKAAAILPFFLFLNSGCGSTASFDLDLADTTAAYVAHDLQLHQELINDVPIGPGIPQQSDHCPTGPDHWYPGSGRSTGTSNLFGTLTETEVYCINADRKQLSGGIATWTDSNGDSIFMTFGATPLHGFAYPAAPSAPLVGFAHFTGGTGKWNGLTGAALFTGKQNGDGTASLDYQGTVYVPK